MRQAGSIAKKRKRYYVVYRTPEKKQKWEGGFATKASAQARLTEILGDIQKGSYVESKATTFRDFSRWWLEGRVSIKGGTWESYRAYLNRHVNPLIGGYKMADIRFSTMQKLVTQLGKKRTIDGCRPLSANTIRKTITMTRTIFRDAIRHGYIRVNPALDVELPKVNKPKVEPPTREDVMAVLEQASADFRTLFLLEVMTGLRRGEILALQWQDIDWLNAELIIQRAISRARSKDGAHKTTWVVGTTKSGKSRRVGLPKLVLSSLQSLRSTTEAASETDFIFTRNGTFIEPDYFTRWIALPLIRKASEGRIRRFHDLRHFFVSMLIDQGETAKYIQEQVGHASITMTMDVYGHLMPKARREAVARLERSVLGKEVNVRTLLEQSDAAEDGRQIN